MTDTPHPPISAEDDPLEARLRALAADVPWPTTPDIAGITVRRLADAPVAARGRAARPGRVLVMALLGLVLCAGIVGAAIVGLPGLRIGVVETLPSPVVIDDPLQLRRILGTPTTLAEADARLGGGLRVPTGLEPPDEVRVGPDGRDWVALVYWVRDGEPALSGDIGLIVTAWRGDVDREYLQKWVQHGTGEVRAVSVDGHPGYWIHGAPHVLETVDQWSGLRRPESRLVGDVLVWQDGDVVRRIESPLGLDTTLDIARSMEPSG